MDPRDSAIYENPGLPPGVRDSDLDDCPEPSKRYDEPLEYPEELPMSTDTATLDTSKWFQPELEQKSRIGVYIRQLHTGLWIAKVDSEYGMSRSTVMGEYPTEHAALAAGHDLIAMRRLNPGKAA